MTAARIAVTMGDPAGVGPEVTVKALARWRAPRGVECIVYGDRGRLAQAAKLCRVPMSKLPMMQDFENVRPNLAWGRVSAAAGRAAADYLHAAADDALDGYVQAIVTAPINKHACRKGGFQWQGHTDMLEDVCGVKRAVMLLVAGDMRVAVLTHHLPVAEAAKRVKRGAIEETANVLLDGLRRDLGIRAPRLAVCGLNPHAGEGGDIGKEDLREIAPSVKALRKRGHRVDGPVSGDTVFVRHLAGEFDAVLAMYHDQGLIPLKLHGFGRAVNITLGLPFVRTSVDHGTAFDIAGTGKAEADSMIAALDAAVGMLRGRKLRPKR